MTDIRKLASYYAITVGSSQEALNTVTYAEELFWSEDILGQSIGRHSEAVNVETYSGEDFLRNGRLTFYLSPEDDTPEQLQLIAEIVEEHLSICERIDGWATDPRQDEPSYRSTDSNDELKACWAGAKYWITPTLHL